jgi:hypothetical protein
VKHLKDGDRDITYLPRSSQPKTATMKYNKQNIAVLITEDERVAGTS